MANRPRTVRRHSVIVVALVALAAIARFAPSAGGADWPQFRGPLGDGRSVETELPGEWGSGHPNIAWKRAIPGRGWSSPIVVGERVYVTTAVATSGKPGGRELQSLRALAVDARSGEVVWNVEVFAPDPAASTQAHAKNSHASPTPLSDGESLWVHFGTNGTARLDLDGTVRWRQRDLRYEPVHGGGGSPLLVGGVLVIACDGAADPFVAGIDAREGRIRWRTPRPESSGKLFAFSTPITIPAPRDRGGGKPQVFVPGADWAASYDAADGRELWRVRHGGYSVVARPVAGHGLVFFASCYDQSTLLAVRTGGSGDVTAQGIAWSDSKSAPHNPSPVLDGDELYCVSDKGIASCFDARTGKVHWRERLGGSHSGSPFVAGGRVWFQSEDGETIVIRATKERLDVLARNDLGERSLASPAPSGGAVFVRTEKHLWCVRSPGAGAAASGRLPGAGGEGER